MVLAHATLIERKNDPMSDLKLRDYAMHVAAYEEYDVGEWFDELAEKDPRILQVHMEVPGVSWPEGEQQRRHRYRIDRVLHVEVHDDLRGDWRGYIGVELKAPRKSTGKALAQCADYVRAGWGKHGVDLLAVYLFNGLIRPKDVCAQGSPMSHFLDTRQIGVCWVDDTERLRFGHGNSVAEFTTWTHKRGSQR